MELWIQHNLSPVCSWQTYATWMDRRTIELLKLLSEPQIFVLHLKFRINKNTFIVQLFLLEKLLSLVQQNQRVDILELRIILQKLYIECWVLELRMKTRRTSPSS